MHDPYKLVEIRERLLQMVRDLPLEALGYTLEVLSEIAREYDQGQPPKAPPPDPRCIQ